MALTDLGTLTFYLKGKLAGCPDGAIMTALIETAREFFRRSEAWIETLPDIAVSAADADIALAVPAAYDAVILRVKQAKQNGAEMHETLWRFDSDGVFYFESAPAAALTLSCRVVFLPALTCHAFPAALFARWTDAFIAGAKATLMGEKGAVWSDPAGAAKAQAEFDSLIGAAKHEGWFGRQSGADQIQLRPFV
jgi:hypothetical protein